MALHFSGFSLIFYAIYKNQQSYFTIGVTLLREGPRKDYCVCNMAPGARWPARLAKIPAARRGSWLGKGCGGSYGVARPGLGAWTGWRGCRRAARRRPVSAAAAAAVPARRTAGWCG
jgi:hypothetical protein